MPRTLRLALLLLVVVPELAFGQAVSRPGSAGPAGPRGAQGPQGIQGSTGPAGTTDWSGITNKPSTYPATTPVATASALASIPSTCSAGLAAQGVDASGNATGCFTPGFTITGSDVSAAKSKGAGTGAVFRTLAARLGDVANVFDFGASGSAQVTTGSISSTVNTTTLTVASAIDFAVGQGISVANAGAASGLLVAKITAINGLAITLDTAASTTASNKAVQHDDTAAIQAAINSFGTLGGPVYLPPGTYEITSALVMKATGGLIGAGNGGSVLVRNATIIDASSITSGFAIAAIYVNSTGLRFEGFTIKGAATGTAALLAISAAGQFTVRNVGFVNGKYGLEVGGGAFGGTIDNVQTQSQVSQGAGLWITASAQITILGGMFANAAGNNILIDSNSSDILFMSPFLDEGFGNTANVLVLGADKVTFVGPRIFYSHGQYGIRLGNGSINPTNCTLMNVRIERYSGGAAPIAALEIRGSGHKLFNVSVDSSADSGGAGTAVSDLAPDTVMHAVTSITTAGTVYTAVKDPGMPTASPGAGTKSLWADPADSYRVKFAN
jgi:hypothetical protein